MLWNLKFQRVKENSCPLDSLFCREKNIWILETQLGHSSNPDNFVLRDFFFSQDPSIPCNVGDSDSEVDRIPQLKWDKK